jgi:hypothetical protein
VRLARWSSTTNSASLGAPIPTSSTTVAAPVLGPTHWPTSARPDTVALTSRAPDPEVVAGAWAAAVEDGAERSVPPPQPATASATARTATDTTPQPLTLPPTAITTQQSPAASPPEAAWS